MEITNELNSFLNSLSIPNQLEKTQADDTKEDNLELLTNSFSQIINQILKGKDTKNDGLGSKKNAKTNKNITLEKNRNLKANGRDLVKLSGTISELADVLSCAVKIMKFMIGFLSS